MYTVTLTENDFLTFQLYESSTNPQRSIKRKKSYLILIISGIILSVMSYWHNDKIFFYIAVLYTGIFILFGKQYLRRRYKAHFTKHVQNTYKGFFEQAVQIGISEEMILTSDKTGDSTIKISEITKIAEISEHFLITISTGPTLIIPKKSSDLNKEIIEMAKLNNLPILNKTDWKWR